MDPAPLTPDQVDKLRGQIARPLRWADGLCGVLRSLGRGADDPLYREAAKVAAALRELDAAAVADAARPPDRALVNPTRDR